MLTKLRACTFDRSILKKPLESAPEVHLDPVRFTREKLGIEPDELQVRVLSATTKRGILNCTRQWGKSTMAAAKAVHRAYTQANALVLVASPSRRQSAEFVRKAAGMVRKLGMRVKGDGDNECSLLFPNESRIIGLPGAEATVRGFSAATLLLIDEAARVADAMYKALRPMIAVSSGELWLMSTPWGKRGFFYDTWARGGDDWVRVSVPAVECPRIPKEFLEEERIRQSKRIWTSVRWISARFIDWLTKLRASAVSLAEQADQPSQARPKRDSRAAAA